MILLICQLRETIEQEESHLDPRHNCDNPGSKTNKILILLSMKDLKTK